MSTWLLVPCHRPRLDDLRESLKYLGHMPARTVVVTTYPDPIQPYDLDPCVTVLISPEPGINISRWFNLGLDYIARSAEDQYEVLCMGSDVRITRETVEVLVREMREHKLAMVGADWYGVATGPVEIRRDSSPGSVYHRIPGVAMLAAGELDLRFDEQFRWWYADDDFEWQHRQAGGTGLVRGQGLQHGAGTPLDAERSQYAIEDLPKFRDKWGTVPH